MIIRVNVSDLRAMGRSTQGVRVLNVDENDTVVGAVKLVDRDDDEDSDSQSADLAPLTDEAAESSETAETDEDNIH